ncbi:MAG: hypothetical protein EPO39_08110 [Candidatus Manganitrophaceae bacterium]|nr:MAG: hypothetical protein EPO39_08110 [Candidatus Manganitrophaceae bacterium]
MRNAECGLRRKNPSASSFYSARPNFARTPLPCLAILGLLFLFSGCQGENSPSPPHLPDGVINLSKTDALSIAPSTAASGNTVYVVWQEHVGGQNMEVLLSRSGDGGAAFGVPINLSRSILFSGNPKVAVSGNFVYVVWEESASADTADNNDLDILYRRGEDQNGTFTWYPSLDQPGLRLSSTNHNCRNNSDTPGDDPCPSQTPAIVASGSNVFVAWSESTVYQFKLITTLNPPTKEFQIINSEILLVRSTDGGVVFDPAPLAVSGPKDDSTLSPSFNPTLAATADRVYIAWEDIPQPQSPPAQSKILFRKLVDPLNLSFSPPLTQQATVLSGFIKGSSRPSLAAEESRVYLAWEGFPPSKSNCPAVQGNTPLSSAEILLIQSQNQGDQFSDPNDCAQSNASDTTGNSNAPRIAVSGPFVYLVWMDNTPGVEGIVLRKSEDSGGTFSAPSDLIQGGGSAANPGIAAVGGTLLSSWEDATLGNLEIVFTRK